MKALVQETRGSVHFTLTKKAPRSRSLPKAFLDSLRV